MESPIRPGPQIHSTRHRHTHAHIYTHSPKRHTFAPDLHLLSQAPVKNFEWLPSGQSFKTWTSFQISTCWKQGYCTIGSSPLRWRNHIHRALVWDENGPSNVLQYFPLLLKLKLLSILSGWTNWREWWKMAKFDSEHTHLLCPPKWGLD